MILYHQYRSYGHGKLIAFALSVSPVYWYGAIAVMSFTLGTVMFTIIN